MTSRSTVSPLVTADELRVRQGDPDWVIVDCRFNLMKPDAGRRAYEDGHIPGAIYADLDRDLASPVAADGSGGRHPLPDADTFAALLRSWGVNTGSRLVAYDDVGNALAGRLWWLARWIGHERVAVLDGGIQAWSGAGHALSTDAPTPLTGNFAGEPGAMPVVSASEVARKLAAQELILLDARAPERFSGAQEPLDTRAGHVPGAINTPFQDNLQAEKCFRTPAELQAYYRAVTDTVPADQVACMCGSGVTACHTLLALELAGIHGAALYTGSWSDWISGAERPVATANDTD